MSIPHHRLIKLVLAGDRVARTHLEREASRRNAELGSLTSSLLGHPCAGAWRRIVGAVENWHADEPPLDDTLAYATCLLDRWPDRVRRAPTHWTTRLLQLEGDEPRIALARVMHIFARSDLDRRGLRILARSPFLAQLSELTLQQVHLDARAVARLAAGTTFSGLRFLDLSCNPLGDEGLRALAASPRLSGVAHLRLHTCGITDVGVKALAASPHAAALEVLDLAQNQITTQGVRLLTERETLPALHTLVVAHNPDITEDALTDGDMLVNVYGTAAAESRGPIWRPQSNAA